MSHPTPDNRKSPERPGNSVAVIGMAGRFPGSDSVSAFWKSLVDGVSGITDVTPRASSSLPAEPNYVAKAAVVKNADHFDAKFFGIYPKQAIDMDPQHRLFLEMCWHAMEDAGYVPDDAPGRVGVFAGCHMNTYVFTRIAADEAFRRSLADSYPGGSLNAEISNDKDYLATRVAYQLNLRGPSVAVQSACSTSLVAIAQACESLVARSCDMAISGGVTATFPQEQGYLHTEDSIISPDGTCRTFDADARGTVFGDGVGAVVLKRLEDAIADRDEIYAVVKGWGVNNDGGDKNGYTAPSVSGQSTAIRLAHQRAGITADTISYVEAHGTGTLVGDPIEVQALTEAFRETTDKKQFCRIASLKTNVGHLDVAAGVTSVIKTSMALKHRQIPPMLHFKSPNPKIDFQNSPFICNTELTDWQTESLPRRAGVSSFGVGGTNAHLILEEAPATQPTKTGRRNHLIRLSAKSPRALDEMTNDLANHLEQHKSVSFPDAAYTLQVGRQSFRYKRFVVAADPAEAATKLRSRSGKDCPTSDRRVGQTPVVFLFPGQGSQHVNMARRLYRSEPVFAYHFDECIDVLTPLLGVNLRSLLFPPDGFPRSPRLDQTEIAQPALFLVSYALGRYWQSIGVQPSMMIGHSVGEFAAAAIAGIMSMADAARLVALRGRLMQDLPSGSMMAVQCPADQVQGWLPQNLEIAAINGPAFCVVSGPTEALEAFASEVEAGKFGEEIACRMLRTSHAFHSQMMDPAIASFEREVRKIDLSAPKIPIISSVTAKRLSDATATDPVYWARQIREPVRFSAAMARVLAEYPRDLILLEVGPNQALSTLARQQPLDLNRQQVLPSLPHAKATEDDDAFLATTIGKLWQSGASISWASIYTGEVRFRVHLPLYRFQRERYSFETNVTAEPEAILADNDSKVEMSVTVDPKVSATSGTGNSLITQTVIAQQMDMMSQQVAMLRQAQARSQQQ